MKFYDKLMLLLEERDITRNKLATDLKLNRNAAQNWLKQDSKPRAEIMCKIADYFSVDVNSLTDDDSDIVYVPMRKHSSEAAHLMSYCQRAGSLRAGYDISDDFLVGLSGFVNASIIFLTDISLKKFEPKEYAVNRNILDIEWNMLFDVLDMSDRCVDSGAARNVLIQISRIVIYRADDCDLYKCVLKEKLDFLYGRDDVPEEMKFGFNFTELMAISKFSGQHFLYLLGGLEEYKNGSITVR